MQCQDMVIDGDILYEHAQYQSGRRTDAAYTIDTFFSGIALVRCDRNSGVLTCCPPEVWVGPLVTFKYKYWWRSSA